MPRISVRSPRDAVLRLNLVPAAGYTTRRYVKKLRQLFDSPASVFPARSEAAAGRSFAPGPSPALALRKTPHFRGPRPKSAARIGFIKVRTSVSRRGVKCQFGHLPPYAAKLRVGPVPNTSSADKLPRKCLCLFLQGKPPTMAAWLSPARYSSATLPEQARQRCFGRPECGPNRAAGADSVGTSPPQTAPVRPNQRPGQVLVFVGQCKRAQDLSTPHQRLCGARTRAVPARGLEAVFPSRTAAVFVGGREPEVSRPLHRQSPLTPHAQRPPPGPTLRFAPGPLWFRDSGLPLRIKAGADSNQLPRITAAAQRLKTIEVAL